jgi:hypothetical protein
LPRSSNSHGPPSCLHVIVFMSALSRVGRRCGYAISLRTPTRHVLLRSCSMPALIRRSVGVFFCPSPKLEPDRRRMADKTQPQPRHPRPPLASPLSRGGHRKRHDRFGSALAYGARLVWRRKGSSPEAARLIASWRRPTPPATVSEVCRLRGVRDFVLKWLEDWHAWVDALFGAVFVDLVRRWRRSLRVRKESAATSLPAVLTRVPEPRAVARTSADVSLTSDRASRPVGVARSAADVSLTADYASWGVAAA